MKGRSMQNTFTSGRARPVSGFHPPNINHKMISRLARTCIGAVALLLGAVSTLSAQTGATISGRVTNHQGVGLPGATGLIQRTSSGSQTDDYGSSTIVSTCLRTNE